MGTKISALPAAATVADADLLPIVQGGTTKNATFAMVRVPPTGTGFRHITAGAEDGASKKVDLTAAADVTVPATANGVVTSSGTVLQQAANVLAGTDYISVGSTPSANGLFRTPYSASTTRCVLGSLHSNAADYPLIRSGVDAVRFGDTTGQTIVDGASVSIYNAGSLMMVNDGVTFNFANPILGSSSAWGSVNGIGTQAMADANQTPAAAVYQCAAITTTGAITANRDLTMPTATSAQGYHKTIVNACTGAFSVNVKCAAGTAVLVANGKTAVVFIDGSGVRRVTADV